MFVYATSKIKKLYTYSCFYIEIVLSYSLRRNQYKYLFYLNNLSDFGGFIYGKISGSITHENIQNEITIYLKIFR